jgi:hypothetical protein
MRVAEFILEATTRAYAKNGATQSLKFRCSSGPRKGQVRASPAACNAPISINKSKTMKQTKRRQGGMMLRKSTVTKSAATGANRTASLNRPKNRGRKKI